MKPARKKVSFNEIVSDADAAIRDMLRFNRVRAYYLSAREKLKDLPKTNYDLGYRFAAQGNWTDAIFRFRVVLYLDPNYPNANYNLGCCYMRIGKNAQARAAFVKALQQSPGNADVTFMLASLDPTALPVAQRPTRMPMDMVTGFFSSQAEGYDITEANNKYQGGKVIYELAKPNVKTEIPTVLDLACGSGIASRPWRAAATVITGVDVTPEMLALAEKATHAEKKLFDVLVTADITQLPPAVATGSADLVLLVNAAQFIGELSSTVNGAAQALKQGGIFVITVEPYAQSGYGLVAETSRFGHSNAYVKQVAAAAGLTPIAEAPVELYTETAAQALLFSKGNQ